MNSSPRHRYTSEPFPSYAHKPGETVHPAKEGGHSFGQSEEVGQRLTPYEAHTHSQFLRGLDLLNHGYFWESHVEFEAIWHAHGRRGVAADLLKTLIKLGAAGVKATVDSPEASTGHLERAKELLTPLNEEECLKWIGLSQKKLLSIIDQALVNKSLLDERGLMAELRLERESS